MTDGESERETATGKQKEEKESSGGRGQTGFSLLWIKGSQRVCEPEAAFPGC